jgi:hypothetical protein
MFDEDLHFVPFTIGDHASLTDHALFPFHIGLEIPNCSPVQQNACIINLTPVSSVKIMFLNPQAPRSFLSFDDVRSDLGLTSVRSWRFESSKHIRLARQGETRKWEIIWNSRPGLEREESVISDMDIPTAAPHSSYTYGHEWHTVRALIKHE